MTLTILNICTQKKNIYSALIEDFVSNWKLYIYGASVKFSERSHEIYSYQQNTFTGSQRAHH